MSQFSLEYLSENQCQNTSLPGDSCIFYHFSEGKLRRYRAYTRLRCYDNLCITSHYRRPKHFKNKSVTSYK